MNEAMCQMQSDQMMLFQIYITSNCVLHEMICQLKCISKSKFYVISLNMSNQMTSNQMVCYIDISSTYLLLLAAPTWLWCRCGRHNSPPASSVMDLVFPMALMSRLTQSIHLCFGLPRFLLPGVTISSVSSYIVLVSPLYVAKPPESRFPAPLCDTHFQFLHVGASDWHCLHPVQHSWLDDHLVYLSLHVWWYHLVA